MVEDPTRRTSPVAARRTVAMVIAAVVLALVAGACSGGDEDASPTPTDPPARSVLRVAVEDWPECLNPLTCASPAAREQVFDRVLPRAMTIGSDGTTTPGPVLAGAPTVDVDVDGGGMTIRYEIDPAARWWDGRPITSSDFVGTWRAVRDTPGATWDGYDDIVEVDDRDPRVAVVRLDRRTSRWTDLFGGDDGYLLQADHFGADTDLTGAFADELPFSAGPFHLASWGERTAILAADPDHWFASGIAGVDQVRLERVSLEDVADPMTYDVLVPAATSATPIERPGGFAARTAAGPAILGLWFDQRSPELASVEVRRVLRALLDASVLADVAAVDDPPECAGWLPGVGPWCAASATDPAATDPDLAAFALAQQGWGRDPDGAWRADGGAGDPLTLRVTHDPADPVTTRVADAVAAELTGFGIAVERAQVAHADWAARRPVEAATGIGVYRWTVGAGADRDRLYRCTGGIESSVLFWCPDPVTAATAALATAVADGAQIDAATAVGDAVADEAAWIPVAVPRRSWFVAEGRVTLPATEPTWGGPLALIDRATVD